jgi:hypothetical protein
MDSDSGFVCPKCRGSEIFRSRTRNVLERSVKVAGPILYYRCRTCDWRGPRVTQESWMSWRHRFLERYAPVLLLGVLLWLLVNTASDLPPLLRSRKKDGGRSAIAVPERTRPA